MDVLPDSHVKSKGAGAAPPSRHHDPGTRQDQDLPCGLNPAQHPIICCHFYGLEVQEAERAA